jgi:hypothetical protein
VSALAFRRPLDDLVDRAEEIRDIVRSSGV